MITISFAAVLPLLLKAFITLIIGSLITIFAIMPCNDVDKKHPGRIALVVYTVVGLVVFFGGTLFTFTK